MKTFTIEEIREISEHILDKYYTDDIRDDTLPRKVASLMYELLISEIMLSEFRPIIPKALLEDEDEATTM